MRFPCGWSLEPLSNGTVVESEVSHSNWLLLLAYLMMKLEHRELKGVAQGRARTVAAALRQSPVFLIPNSVIFPLSPCPQCLPY